MEEIRRKTNLISKINDRAEELGIIVDSRLNHFMDIDYATQVFNIDLEAWLDSADTDFMHDYVGIYRNIDRDAISLKHAASQNDFGTLKAYSNAAANLADIPFLPVMTLLT